MKQMKWVLGLFVLIGFSVSSLGCVMFVPGVVALGAAAGGGAATAMYIRGDLESTLNADVEKSHQATERTLEELGYAITKGGKGGLEREIVARGSGDKKVKIILKSEGELTRISIRCGFFGNETISRQILEKIQANLSKA